MLLNSLSWVEDVDGMLTCDSSSSTRSWIIELNWSIEIPWNGFKTLAPLPISRSTILSFISLVWTLSKKQKAKDTRENTNCITSTVAPRQCRRLPWSVSFSIFAAFRESLFAPKTLMTHSQPYTTMCNHQYCREENDRVYHYVLFQFVSGRCALMHWKTVWATTGSRLVLALCELVALLERTPCTRLAQPKSYDEAVTDFVARNVKPQTSGKCFAHSTQSIQHNASESTRSIKNI